MWDSRACCLSLVLWNCCCLLELSLRHLPLVWRQALLHCCIHSFLPSLSICDFTSCVPGGFVLAKHGADELFLWLTCLFCGSFTHGPFLLSLPSPLREKVFLRLVCCPERSGIVAQNSCVLWCCAHFVIFSFEFISSNCIFTGYQLSIDLNLYRAVAVFLWRRYIWVFQP